MTDHVKLFISYCWSSEEHEKWVLSLATGLQELGVEVFLDKWDLREGHDAHQFMERMVTSPDIKKVILVCDKTYVEKANDRKGGVGIETQIITPEIYQKAEQDKFVAVVAERDESGSPYLPTYYKSRIFIDLSDEDQFAKNFEQLLRWVYSKPLYEKPALGTKPAFLEEKVGPSLETTAVYSRAISAIRSDKANWSFVLGEYFDFFSQKLENFRISLKSDEADEEVAKSIDQFLPYRNEALEVFLAAAQYKTDDILSQSIHRFFEKLLPYLERPEHITSYTDWDFDNFKFIVHELFLYAVAAFLKYERYEVVAYLLSQEYFVGNRERNNGMVSFLEFRKYMPCFEGRDRRLGRVSSRADLLKDRSKTSGIEFSSLMQADFTIFIRSSIEAMKAQNGYLQWWPETLLYSTFGNLKVFEVYARAQSKAYFKKISPVLGVSKKEELENLLNFFNRGDLNAPKWQFHSLEIVELLCLERMATKE